jgi:hypothetical protein
MHRVWSILALLLCACSSSGGAPGGVDAGSDGTGTQQDTGAAGCVQTVEAACAAPETPGTFEVHCVMPYGAVATDTHYCGTTITDLTATCGAYQARIDVNVDVEFTYYYDATGALAAIVHSGANMPATCLAGPAAGFVAPACETPQPLHQCGGDAGQD